MDSLDIHNPKVVSEAIVVWTGKGDSPGPDPDEQRLVRRFGALGAADLLPLLQRLADEFDESDAYATVPGAAEMGDAAAERFRKLHPELTDEAVEALAWCYSWRWK